VIDKQGNVIQPFAQGRHDDWNHIESVEQIFLEYARAHELAQVAVGRGDDADVDWDRALGAKRLNLAFLAERATASTADRGPWYQSRRGRWFRHLARGTCLWGWRRLR
jgi:hypothetical protein